MTEEPYHFSRRVENLIANFRDLPEDRGRSRRRAPRELAPLVEELLAKYQIGRAAPEHRIREHWPALVGAANAGYSHAVRIEAGRLLVLVSHSVVREELFFHREEILGRIRQLPGCQHVRMLNLRAG